jgi:hypothetical protein
LFSFELGLRLTSPDWLFVLLKGSFDLSTEKLTIFGLGALLLSLDMSIRAISFVNGDGYVVLRFFIVELILEGEGIFVALLSMPEKRKVDTLNPSAWIELFRLGLPVFLVDAKLFYMLCIKEFIFWNVSKYAFEGVTSLVVFFCVRLTA